MNGRRSRTVAKPSLPDATADCQNGDECQPDTVSSETLLALLGDEYARKLLTLLVERPRTGRELAAATEMSRPTIYRRLERLDENGLIRTEMQFDPDGHHRKRFHTIVSGFDFEVGPDGIEASAQNPGDERS
ncbi:ArsR/SmtB family transcription factor [Halorhabdus amylolytica]|uniref:ArsR/SmtB family transcription factor n=1 Tax=Halorhabdus amylolytica TaxID=2559573 RepID=UPI0010AAE75A|nr:winged helix-turn-helix domain-containing protein [Halorhabdus amylolytica]